MCEKAYIVGMQDVGLLIHFTRTQIRLCLVETSWYGACDLRYSGPQKKFRGGSTI